MVVVVAVMILSMTGGGGGSSRDHGDDPEDDPGDHSDSHDTNVPDECFLPSHAWKQPFYHPRGHRRGCQNPTTASTLDLAKRWGQGQTFFIKQHVQAGRV